MLSHRAMESEESNRRGVRTWGEIEFHGTKHRGWYLIMWKLKGEVGRERYIEKERNNESECVRPK